MKRILSVGLLLVLILALLFALGGCGKPEEAAPSPSPTTAVPVPSEKPSPKPSAAPAPSPTAPAFTNPLTGEAVAVDLSMNRPYAIMINNLIAAQPQCGISNADIIFEVPVEGYITRMMAVFQDPTDAGTIGSVRSCRHYYLDLAGAFDAIYIHAGGSPQGYYRLYSYDVDHVDGVNGADDIFYRDEDRLAYMDLEHTLMTSGELIDQYVPTYGFRMEHEAGYTNNLIFAQESALTGGTAASEITVNVTPDKVTRFSYNAQTGKYGVTQYDDTYADGNNDAAFEPANVLVLRADIYVMDDEGRVHVELESSGTGYLFTNGQAAEIKWSKESMDAPFVFTYADGSPMELSVGKSYVCVTYDDSEIIF